MGSLPQVTSKKLRNRVYHPPFPGCPIVLQSRYPSQISPESPTGWSQPISVQQTDAKPVCSRPERISIYNSPLPSTHEEEGIRPAVLKLGLEFNIVTVYTALVAVDPRTQDRQSAISINQAAVVPEG